jgi:hypothetical protein
MSERIPCKNYGFMAGLVGDLPPASTGENVTRFYAVPQSPVKTWFELEWLVPSNQSATRQPFWTVLNDIDTREPMTFDDEDDARRYFRGFGGSRGFRLIKRTREILAGPGSEQPKGR